jgi:hypothetical protein
MKKILTTLVLSLMLSSSVMAQESSNDAAMQNKTTLYVHPLSLIVGAAADILPLMLNFTIEQYLAPKAALIITPNYFMWDLSAGTNDEFSLKGFGAGIGYRKYLGKPASGVYLQTKADIGYWMGTADYINYSFQNKTADFSGIGASILGYVGVKGKWDRISMFIDAGVGYGYLGMEADVPDADLNFDFGSTGVDFDFNFALGYSF